MLSIWLVIIYLFIMLIFVSVIVVVFKIVVSVLLLEFEVINVFIRVIFEMVLELDINGVCSVVGILWISLNFKKVVSRIIKIR